MRDVVEDQNYNNLSYIISSIIFKYTEFLKESLACIFYSIQNLTQKSKTNFPKIENRKIGNGFHFATQASTIHACKIRVEFSWFETPHHPFSYITLSYDKSKPAFASPMTL